MGALTGHRLAVFGLGEAGSVIAADLVEAGAEVLGYDPAPVTMPLGVTRVADPVGAVRDVSLVLAVTASADAMSALTQALGSIPAGCLYADLSTASPDAKRGLGAVAERAELSFVDVALMSTVPGKGLFTPALASGPGADRFAALVSTAGADVEVVGIEPGVAATRKLLRSVVLKGFAALVIESMRAANAAGLADETWDNLVWQFTHIDEDFLRRVVVGTGPHALRRLHEMEAATELLESLHIDPVMTRSTVESLRRIPVDGLPALPPGRA